MLLAQLLVLTIAEGKTRYAHTAMISNVKHVNIMTKERHVVHAQLQDLQQALGFHEYAQVRQLD